MEDTNYECALYQVNEVIKHMEESLKNKIPENYISYIEKNKAKNYNWVYNESQELYNQDLLPKAKSILTVLYQDFLCENEEKERLETILLKNENQFQEQAKKKYSTDNLFKNKNLEKNLAINSDISITQINYNNENLDNEKIKKENMEIIKYKESFLKKLINKIKKMVK